VGREIVINGGCMKKQILTVAGVLVGIGFWTGSAQAQTGGVRATVPFHFMVGGKTFAAGEYMMVPGRQRVSVVSAADGRTVAIALANNVSGHFAGATGRIIFRCYDTRCFLAELWSPTEQYGRQLLISSAESESSRERRGNYFAILGTKPAK
jgi:hypothetical protein